MRSPRATGLDVGPPDGVYEIVDPLSADTVLDIDADAAELVHRSLYAGGFALKSALPEQHPVLWPEHFDVAVTEDEVNYGVSPGDDFHPLPYAYVGPWTSRIGDVLERPVRCLPVTRPVARRRPARRRHRRLLRTRPRRAVISSPRAESPALLQSDDVWTAS